MSSSATADEVRSLVDSALDRRDLCVGDVSLLATRATFVGDRRLDFGLPISAVADERLVAASAPCDRRVGIPARVAETAALVAAGSDSALIGAVERSAHVTVAVARGHSNGAGR
jgi:cobalamin biosynthesis protein CbiG